MPPVTMRQSAEAQRFCAAGGRPRLHCNALGGILLVNSREEQHRGLSATIAEMYLCAGALRLRIRRAER
jgi:hypothetical protein